MTEDISQRRIKTTKRKEEVIKAQTPGPKTAEAFRQEASDKKSNNTDTKTNWSSWLYLSPSDNDDAL